VLYAAKQCVKTSKQCLSAQYMAFVQFLYQAAVRCRMQRLS
jgi:hypothetical protein